MSGVQETSCKLCLKTITVEGFEVINNVIRDILDILLLKLKFDSEGNEVICNACRRKLYAALEFKSACLKTDYTIIPYLDCEKMLELDIRDVYTKEKTSESMDISDGQKICRLCMEPVESEVRCIRKEELEAIEKLAPELIINIIKDPVVCKECFESVCIHNSFLKNCSDVQEKTRGIFNSAAAESQIDTSPSDLFLKTENQDIEFDINGREMSIKAESIDIKSEDEERSDSLLQSSDSGSFMKSVLRDAEEDGCKHENRLTNECNTKDKQDDKVFYKCDKGIYKTGSESRFIAHRARHENGSETYKYESCESETENNIVQEHQLGHKDPSEMRKHRCGSYDYKTKHKCELAKHQVKHKSASGGRLCECDFCDFTTKRKVSFNILYIKHKNSNNRVECDHKTKYTALPNNDTLQLPIYKCDDCTYESKNKGNFTTHQLIHKDPSQMQMHKCKDCVYKTKYKSNMNKHQLKHKDPLQVQTYRCNDCDYKTIYKCYMKKHQLKHKVPLQVETYRCNDCGYKTIHKRYLKSHQLKHKDPSQVQMYRCNYCDFKTKYKQFDSS
ncbi:zinc finger protein 2-like [Anoplophora glabripennis]|uniref:zinc finger protein 2-like n=1 Tax=Anoplophora glabripennis TaxID=217634 RepID=UPI0008754B4B|nr:zinc finger protein 2-like [Anoplophora glabripennis]